MMSDGCCAVWTVSLECGQISGLCSISSEWVSILLSSLLLNTTFWFLQISFLNLQRYLSISSLFIFFMMPPNIWNKCNLGEIKPSLGRKKNSASAYDLVYYIFEKGKLWIVENQCCKRRLDVSFYSTNCVRHWIYR